MVSFSAVRRPAQWVLGAVLSVSVIYWFATALDVRQVLFALGGVRGSWLAAGLLMVLLTLGVRMLRWRALLGSEAQDVSALGTLQAVVVGQLYNLILPARLGDVVRAYVIKREGYASTAQALGTIVLEKVWDIVLLAGLVGGLTFWHPLPAWLAAPARAITAGGGVVVAGLVALLVVGRYGMWRPRVGWLARRGWVAGWLAGWKSCKAWLEAWKGGRVAEWLYGWGTGFAAGLRGLYRPQAMLAAGGWSLLVWLFGALTNLAVLRALELPPSLGVALLLLAVLQFGMVVPSLPGRIGVFEGVSVAVLALSGVQTELALAYGLMLHAVVLLPPAVLGAWWLLRLDGSSQILT